MHWQPQAILNALRLQLLQDDNLRGFRVFTTDQQLSKALLQVLKEGANFPNRIDAENHIWRWLSKTVETQYISSPVDPFWHLLQNVLAPAHLGKGEIRGSASSTLSVSGRDIEVHHSKGSTLKKSSRGTQRKSGATTPLKRKSGTTTPLKRKSGTTTPLKRKSGAATPLKKPQPKQHASKGSTLKKSSRSTQNHTTLKQTSSKTGSHRPYQSQSSSTKRVSNKSMEKRQATPPPKSSKKPSKELEKIQQMMHFPLWEAKSKANQIRLDWLQHEETMHLSQWLGQRENHLQFCDLLEKGASHETQEQALQFLKEQIQRASSYPKHFWEHLEKCFNQPKKKTKSLSSSSTSSSLKKSSSSSSTSKLVLPTSKQSPQKTSKTSTTSTTSSTKVLDNKSVQKAPNPPEAPKDAYSSSMEVQLPDYLFAEKTEQKVETEQDNSPPPQVQPTKPSPPSAPATPLSPQKSQTKPETSGRNSKMIIAAIAASWIVLLTLLGFLLLSGGPKVDGTLFGEESKLYKGWLPIEKAYRKKSTLILLLKANWKKETTAEKVEDLLFEKRSKIKAKEIRSIRVLTPSGTTLCNINLE